MKQADALRHAFLGLDFDRLDAQAAARKVLTLARGNRFSYIVTPNVDHVVQLDRSGDSELAGAYRGADLCLCDSRNLARLARWSGIDLPVVTGSDLTRDLLVTVLPRAKLAVVGGDERIHRDLEALFPRFEWSFHTPPMGIRRDPAARTAIAEFVETVDADVVFLAVGAPQSEMICAEISQRGRARGVALCIGASLEFLTGAKYRAPLWMQRAGFEWLFRLLSEPGRLWRRYLLDGPRIFILWQQWNQRRDVNVARLPA